MLKQGLWSVALGRGWQSVHVHVVNVAHLHIRTCGLVAERRGKLSTDSNGSSADGRRTRETTTQGKRNPRANESQWGLPC